MRDILPILNQKDYIKEITKDYDVHFCQQGEADELVEFIDRHWKKNHILAVSRELLDWQHYDKENKRYNFVIARHRITGEIHSILGFVPTHQFDSSINNTEVWLCIWKTREDIKVKGLGSSLVYYLKNEIKIETISQIGISEANVQISKKWGFTTGVADHYYLANDSAEEVLSKNLKKSSALQTDDSAKLKELSVDEYCETSDETEIFKAGINRYKSKDYYINRYFRHPVYKYTFYSIWKENGIVTIFVARECSALDRKCLRIVDAIGDIENLGLVRNQLCDIMKNCGYEYIDFIVCGVDNEIMEKTGFVNRMDNQETVVPNYFEPFLRENIDLRYAIKTVSDENIIIFKGDSDQDRPNTI